MPKKKRIIKGGIAYHVLNRANGRLKIFKKDQDFIAFENILAEGIERFGMRVCGYCIMSNHWHMLLWPDADNVLPDFMHWVTLTHVRRWHAAHGTEGIGHVYQGRYKSFPVQSSWHYLKTLRYIEANPMRAGLVEDSSDWQWSSLTRRKQPTTPFPISPGPVAIPDNWQKKVNACVPQQDIDRFANCIKRGCPYGEKQWIIKAAEELNLESTIRKRGRPRKYV